jgi:hypothetical protein
VASKPNPGSQLLDCISVDRSLCCLSLSLSLCLSLSLSVSLSLRLYLPVTRLLPLSVLVLLLSDSVSSPPSPSPVIEHENIWPRPSSEQQPSQPPASSSTQQEGEAFPLGSLNPPPHPIPTSPSRSFSSIFEAYYLFFAKFILKKKSQKNPKKKLKKKKNQIPSRDVSEGFDVLLYILNEITEKKYLNKSFLTNYGEKVAVCHRELPLYKEEVSERHLSLLCEELIQQLHAEGPALLIAKNEIMAFRQILGYIFGLYGVIYECCLLLLDEIIPTRYISPSPTLSSPSDTSTSTATQQQQQVSSSIPTAYVELIEKVSLFIFPKIFGAEPKIDYLNLSHLSQTNTTTVAPIEKEGGGKSNTSPVKNKKSNGKKGKGKSTAVTGPTDGPLQPYEIIQRMNIALSDFNSTLKTFSLDPSFELLQKWIRDLMNKRTECRVDRSWDVCSKITSPDNIYPISSEDRHIICGYQVRYTLLLNQSLFTLFLTVTVTVTVSLSRPVDLSLLNSLSLSVSLCLSLSTSLS